MAAEAVVVGIMSLVLAVRVVAALALHQEQQHQELPILVAVVAVQFTLVAVEHLERAVLEL
jgi:hypothetical protein